MAFSLVLHGTVPKDEICGVIVGHSEFLIRLREMMGTGNSYCSRFFPS